MWNIVRYQIAAFCVSELRRHPRVTPPSAPEDRKRGCGPPGPGIRPGFKGRRLISFVRDRLGDSLPISGCVSISRSCRGRNPRLFQLPPNGRAIFKNL